MRSVNIFILCAGLLTLASCTQKEDNTLVWADEFDGPELCSDYWTAEDNARGGGNAELQYFSPKNISIERHPVTGESCLVLTARREDYYYNLASDTLHAAQGYRPCTSARLNTQDKVTIEYGRIEARIAFPQTGNGLWPAFWMLGNNLMTDLGNDDSNDNKTEEGRVNWPKCGEIDICEMGHKTGIEQGITDRYFNGAAHWGESWNNGAYPNQGGFYTAPYPVQGDFHIWRLDWTPDSIAMYLDTIPEPYFALSLRNKEVGEPGHYFNHPFYLVLNLSVGGFFPDMPNPDKYSDRIEPELLEPVTALPADGTPVKMYVDYIRVYRNQ